MYGEQEWRSGEWAGGHFRSSGICESVVSRTPMVEMKDSEQNKDPLCLQDPLTLGPKILKCILSEYCVKHNTNTKTNFKQCTKNKSYIYLLSLNFSIFFQEYTKLVCVFIKTFCLRRLCHHLIVT